MNKLMISLVGLLVAGSALIASTANAARPARGQEIKEAEVVAAEAQGGLRYSIMVAKFEDKSGWPGAYNITQAWSEMLSSQLSQDGRFIVVGEKDMRKEAMIEQDFNNSGRIQQGGKMSAEVGHMTPAQLLVKGTVISVADNTSGGSGSGRIGDFPISIGRDESAVRITLQVVDAQTGQVVAADDVIGKAHKSRLGIGNLPILSTLNIQKNDMVANACADALKKAVNVIANSLEKIRWQATVVDASPGGIMINRGEREGVPLGQQFIVGNAEKIIDPDSGEFLDYRFEEVGRVEVTKVSNRIAYCKIVSSRGTVAKNMTVMVPES
jgi:curli biogenesis system outer membrane secretion channel CsgG